MSWVKLDDQFPTHPKMVAAGGDAAWLHVCALCYCAQHLTDGLLPKAMVSRLSDRRQPEKLAERLVAAGAWIDRGDTFELHGYLEFNPSREHVLSERRKAAERRAKGGRASADVRANATRPDPTPPLDSPNGESRAPFETDFEQLWKSYPRKRDRGAAFKAYQARRRAGATHAALLAAVEHYAESVAGTEERFVKYGATSLGATGDWTEWVTVPEPPSLEQLAEPTPPKPARVCPLGECDGTGFVDVPGTKTATACRCRGVKVSA